MKRQLSEQEVCHGNGYMLAVVKLMVLILESRFVFGCFAASAPVCMRSAPSRTGGCDA
jgi:hypothetical protein